MVEVHACRLIPILLINAMNTFIGRSLRNDLAEALSDAVKQAAQMEVGADLLVKWTIFKISGKFGGISGGSELSVTIVTEI